LGRFFLSDARLTIFNIQFSMLEPIAHPKERLMPKTEAVLFDFDGVIIDSMPQVHHAACAVLSRHGIALPDLPEFCRTFFQPYWEYFGGKGVRATPEEMMGIFMPQFHPENGHVFPQFLALLTELKRHGYATGIISGHDRPHILERLKRERIAFDEGDPIIGDADRKDAALIAFYRERRFDASEIFYVGDLGSDVRDGKKAGVRTVGFLGHGGPETFRNDPPDHLIANHLELLRYL
jgi:phosphoglycolate phosphatase-like HAD superfamily hydrolase